MGSGARSTAELVRSATVVVAAGASPETATALGSGFFVANQRVLTCAHVIRSRRDLWIEWHGRMFSAALRQMQPSDTPQQGTVDFPDTAVLAVPDIGEHPSVSLSLEQPAEGAELYAYGVTRVRTGILEPDSSLLTFTGLAGEVGASLYKLSRGFVASGQSGGPLLNRDTGQVCAMVKQSLSPTGQDGGTAIPIEAALAVALPEDLLAANLAEHVDGVAALRREQATLSPLPELVIADLRSAPVVPALAVQLGVLGVDAPTPRDADDPEWVGRQLFRLTLLDLIYVLNNARAVSDGLAAEILWKVACCLPADEQPLSWWVPAEAALALRTEWLAEQPRVVSLASSYDRTREYLARRALGARTTELRLPPFTAETDPNGLPSALSDDVRAELCRLLNVTPEVWRNNRALPTKFARRLGQIITIDPAMVADREFLLALRTEFGGLYFMVASRDAPAPATAELVLQLKPLVDENVESIADYAFGQLDPARG